jgi:ubiquinone/menaquinone biosynthesis C-methylase UbiE
MSIANGSSGGGVLAKRYPSFDIIGALVQRLSNNLSFYYSRAKSLVYDVVILRMTEKWYRAVLQKLDDGSIILDVGVGTGGALLRCADLIEAKKLKVVGIDIDTAYVEAGKASIIEANLSDSISIDKVDVYEGKEKILELAKKLGADVNSHGQFVDAVYFSGSFSLLPDPVKALQLVSEFVKRNTKTGVDGGAIYITQTYQRKTPFLLPYAKPLLKYATTIDFGKLVKEEEVLQIFKESGLEVVEHNVIPESVDNRFQAAYLSILR